MSHAFSLLMVELAAEYYLRKKVTLTKELITVIICHGMVLWFSIHLTMYRITYIFILTAFRLSQVMKFP